MTYPPLVIDAGKYPGLARNIWEAQMAGWPRVLTYNGPDILLARANRAAAMHYEYAGERYEIPRIMSRDEYPFACTAEGGSGWVGHIPPKENSAQGGLICQFLRRHEIRPGRGERSKFRVEVVGLGASPRTVTRVVAPLR